MQRIRLSSNPSIQKKSLRGRSPMLSPPTSRSDGSNAQVSVLPKTVSLQSSCCWCGRGGAGRRSWCRSGNRSCRSVGGGAGGGVVAAFIRLVVDAVYPLCVCPFNPLAAKPTQVREPALPRSTNCSPSVPSAAAMAMALFEFSFE